MYQNSSVFFLFLFLFVKLHLLHSNIVYFKLNMSQFISHILLTKCIFHIALVALHLSYCICPIVFVNLCFILQLVSYNLNPANCILQTENHNLHILMCILQLATFILYLGSCILQLKFFSIHLALEFCKIYLATCILQLEFCKIHLATCILHIAMCILRKCTFGRAKQIR